jgi:hypothetical protein
MLIKRDRYRAHFGNNLSGLSWKWQYNSLLEYVDIFMHFSPLNEDCSV